MPPPPPRGKQSPTSIRSDSRMGRGRWRARPGLDYRDPVRTSVFRGPRLSPRGAESVGSGVGLEAGAGWAWKVPRVDAHSPGAARGPGRGEGGRRGFWQPGSSGRARSRPCGGAGVSHTVARPSLPGPGCPSEGPAGGRCPGQTLRPPRMLRWPDTPGPVPGIPAFRRTPRAAPSLLGERAPRARYGAGGRRGAGRPRGTRGRLLLAPPPPRRRV